MKKSVYLVLETNSIVASAPSETNPNTEERDRRER